MYELLYVLSKINIHQHKVVFKGRSPGILVAPIDTSYFEGL